MLGPAPDQHTNCLGRQRDEPSRSQVLGVAEHGAAARLSSIRNVRPPMSRSPSHAPARFAVNRFVGRPTLASSAWDVRSAARQYVAPPSDRALDEGSSSA